MIHSPSKKRLEFLRSECAAVVDGICGHTLRIAVGGTLVGISFSCGGARFAADCFFGMRLVFLRFSLFKKCVSSCGDQNGFVVCTHVRRFQMSRTAFGVMPNSMANRVARRSRFERSCLAALKMRIASFDEIVQTPLPCDEFLSVLLGHLGLSGSKERE